MINDRCTASNLHCSLTFCHVHVVVRQENKIIWVSPSVLFTITHESVLDLYSCNTTCIHSQLQMSKVFEVKFCLYSNPSVLLCVFGALARGYITFFMLSSTKYEISTAHKNYDAEIYRLFLLPNSQMLYLSC